MLDDQAERDHFKDKKKAEAARAAGHKQDA